MRSNTKASDQRTLLLTVPMTVFPIPMVKIEVRVEAGVVSEVGTTAEFPTTIWIAKASPKARAIPKTTAVKIPERDMPNGLPAGRTNGHTSFPVMTGHSSEAIGRHEGDSWQDHNKEDKDP